MLTVSIKLLQKIISSQFTVVIAGWRYGTRGMRVRVDLKVQNVGAGAGRTVGPFDSAGAIA